MFRFALGSVLCLLATGCSTVTIADLDGNTDKVEISGLGELARASQPVTLITVHGVNDTCRGYALRELGDEQDTNSPPWLDKKQLEKLGIRVTQSGYRDSAITAGDAGIDAIADTSTPVVDLRQAEFTLTFPGAASPMSVRVVEVTWSPMTRWIKDALLGYDQTRMAGLDVEYPAGSKHYLAHGVSDCGASGDPRTESVGDVKALPPSRVALNAALKWSLMDRALADAVIYAGTYGGAMQRAMSLALCKAVQPEVAGPGACTWPGRDTILQRRYAFVTHSLGSRLVYDTLLALSFGPQPKYSCTNCGVERTSQTSEAALAIMDRTTGVYMMANQLTMLGLANVPLDAPQGVQDPYLMPPKESSISRLPLNIGTSLMNVTAAQHTQQLSDPLFTLLKGLKPNAQSSLEIVSFNDTNDLLTWHIPEWYQSAAPGVTLRAANVFLQNSLPFAGVFENPLAAHQGYAANPAVWALVFCGAHEGRIASCGR
jgi:hypothetical protein